MSGRAGGLAAEKDALLERSAASRLRLRGRANNLRAALQWTRLAREAVRPLRRFALGLAVAAVVKLIAPAKARKKP
jgi:hypothetical protein